MDQIIEKLNKKPLYVVLLTLFVDMLGYGILIPVIPQLLANEDSPYSLLPINYSPDQGYILLGFLVGIFPLMQFLSTPIMGQLSDRYGRKKILAIALSGTSLSYVAFAYAIITRNLPLLFISRAVDGITGGNISVAQAAIADVSTPENRARNFGLIGAAFGLGLIIGPYIGGKLSDANFVPWFNAATPFWFAAGLSLINVFSVLVFFPETLKNIQARIRIEWFRSFRNIVAAARLRQVRIPFISSFLFQAGFSFFITFFSVYLIRKFGFTETRIGELFAYVGVWTIISQAIITRNVAKRISEARVLRFSLIAAGMLTAAFFVPQHAWGLFVISPFFAMCIGLTQANMPGIISRSVSPEVQGQVLGINASINALAQAIPPILSGYIAALITPETPIILAAAVITLGGLVFTGLYKNKPNLQTQNPA